MARTIVVPMTAIQPATAGQVCNAARTLLELPANTIFRFTDAGNVEEQRLGDIAGIVAGVRDRACAADPALVMDDEESAAAVAAYKVLQRDTVSSVLMWGGSIGLAIGLGITIAANR